MLVFSPQEGKTLAAAGDLLEIAAADLGLVTVTAFGSFNGQAVFEGADLSQQNWRALTAYDINTNAPVSLIAGPGNWYVLTSGVVVLRVRMTVADSLGGGMQVCIGAGSTAGNLNALVAAFSGQLTAMRLMLADAFGTSLISPVDIAGNEE